MSSHIFASNIAALSQDAKQISHDLLPSMLSLVEPQETRAIAETAALVVSFYMTCDKVDMVVKDLSQEAQQKVSNHDCNLWANLETCVNALSSTLSLLQDSMNMIKESRSAVVGKVTHNTVSQWSNGQTDNVKGMVQDMVNQVSLIPSILNV